MQKLSQCNSTRSSRVPSYRRHKRGNAYVRLKGRQIYLGKADTDDSWQKYWRLIAEFKAADGNIPGGSELTVTQLLAAFWLHAEKHYRRKDGSSTGAADNFKPTIKAMRELYGTVLVSEFGPRSLKAVRQIFVESNCSRSYCNDVASRVRAIFKWAVAEEIVVVEILQALQAVTALREGRTEARESEPVLPVPDEIVAKTLPFLPTMVADMVKVQGLTGMRPSEICEFRFDETNRAADPWEFRPTKHKTAHKGRGRVVFIGPQAQEILVNYLPESKLDYCFDPSKSEIAQRNLRTQQRCTPASCGNVAEVLEHPADRKFREYYSTDSYRRAIHRACDQAFPAPDELEEKAKKEWQSKHRWSPNQLRHAFGTKVRGRYGLEHSQVVLGHARADVTQIYAERDLSKARNVVRKIG